MRSQPSDHWQVGSAYERYVGRWSRHVAPAFLAWLDEPPGRRWVDVGCGTGALCSAIVERCAPAALTGVEPSGGFIAAARQALADRVDLRQGSAAAIPLPDDSVDVVVSGLVLNFLPDLPAALRESARVCTPGGTFGAYVWDYAGRMELMRHFWDAAVALDAAAVQWDEGRRFPICRPDALLGACAAAGFGAAETTAIEIATPFASFEDFWEPFLGGQGPAPAYAMSLDEQARNELRRTLRERLPAEDDGSIRMVARAWAVRATV
ncbi:MULTISPECIES: class I SAM-dependent methyltransferase [Ramlibacter]|uniref:Methyltransferase domain-containing protein n=1 Tax=Ramlibacter pinisoli TaxID=2682844 RepID=A0A6N8IY80_9BURK|nr:MULTISPECIES: class I SAM-dependent methyltransferase [Ramlibacter]MBA2961835.1 class I SAM-dependent methyltransferase [Ramlibacter sp. CGMCC 1.13660]MVQ31777.1 methyltransferase domain-containing protein [Ramlibacter pinisoli]